MMLLYKWHSILKYPMISMKNIFHIVAYEKLQWKQLNSTEVITFIKYFYMYGQIKLSVEKTGPNHKKTAIQGVHRNVYKHV